MTTASDTTPPFIDRLARCLAEDPLREKLLLSPSHRVGGQWLDRAALAAGGIANARTTTLSRVLLDLADAELGRRGLRVPPRQEKIRMIGLILAEMARHPEEDGYFTSLDSTPELAEKLLDTAEELDAALVRGGPGLAAAVSPPAKARELSRLAQAYRAARRREGLAGPADIGDAALAGLGALSKQGRLPLLLTPESVLEDCTPLEWRVLSRWPEADRRRIDDDDPPARPDCSFFVADSVLGEAREVLRRIQDEELPLDRVEVATTDPGAYGPALAAALLEAFGGPPEALPATFAAGLPGIHARPVRQLAAWLEWLEQDTPPEDLARMLDAGLLGEGWRRTAPGLSAPEVAAWVRSLPLDGGLGEYRRVFAGKDERRGAARAGGWLAEQMEAIVPERRRTAAGPAAVLEAGLAFLDLGTEADGMLDAYARRSLREALRQWLPHADWPGFDAAAWLRRLLPELRVMGLGPMPGRLHISDLASGGHSGRERIFVLGLDDGRHPGSARQDPVLLDRERLGISSGLFRSTRRREAREKALQRLLARTPGRVTLSHARTAAGSGREQFPAAAFSRLLRETEGVAAASGLVPVRETESLNDREDWLAALAAAPVPDALALAGWFPHLAAGERAVRNRASDRFTSHDANVPEAGADWLAGERVLSPSDLESLAKNPFAFFLRRILKVVPPDRRQRRPGAWLMGNVRGELLHNLFQDFLVPMLEDGRRLTPENRDEESARLHGLLDAALRREERRNPAADHLARAREERDLREACDIFIETEIRRQQAGRPVCLEASLGGAEADLPPWRRVRPLSLAFPPGPPVHLRGRVDRVDRLDDHGGLLITDYKSGRSDDFSASDPFRQGRTLQPLLYTLMLEQALADSGRPEPVRGFRYAFVMPRDEGRSIVYPRELLAEGGLETAGLLIRLLAAGRFPFTTEKDDDRAHDYEAIVGSHAELALAALEKTRRDPALADWARLRGIHDDGEGDDAPDA